MPFEELRIDLVLAGSDERCVFDRFEVLCVVILADVCLEANGKDDAMIVGETDESFIEGLVVKRGETDAVFGIESFLLIIGPWDDVAGNEQFGEINASQGASAIVIGEDYLTEYVLINACLDFAKLCLAYNALWDVTDFLFVFLFDSRTLVLSKNALTLEQETLTVVDELTPILTALLASVPHA